MSARLCACLFNILFLILSVCNGAAGLSSCTSTTSEYAQADFTNAFSDTTDMKSTAPFVLDTRLAFDGDTLVGISTAAGVSGADMTVTSISLDGYWYNGLSAPSLTSLFDGLWSLESEPDYHLDYFINPQTGLNYTESKQAVVFNAENPKQVAISGQYVAWTQDSLSDPTKSTVMVQKQVHRANLTSALQDSVSISLSFDWPSRTGVSQSHPSICSDYLAYQELDSSNLASVWLYHLVAGSKEPLNQIEGQTRSYFFPVLTSRSTSDDSADWPVASCVATWMEASHTISVDTNKNLALGSTAVALSWLNSVTIHMLLLPSRASLSISSSQWQTGSYTLLHNGFVSGDYLFVLVSYADLSSYMIRVAYLPTFLRSGTLTFSDVTSSVSSFPLRFANGQNEALLYWQNAGSDWNLNGLYFTGSSDKSYYETHCTVLSTPATSSVLSTAFSTDTVFYSDGTKLHRIDLNKDNDILWDLTDLFPLNGHEITDSDNDGVGDGEDIVTATGPCVTSSTEKCLPDLTILYIEWSCFVAVTSVCVWFGVRFFKRQYRRAMELAEQAVEYAIESGSFEQAFELARTACKTKLPEVHLKHALRLEDDQRFKEAEEEFIKANKPKEAIDMYIHQQDWLSAMRVAENHEPASISEVWLAQARAAEQRKDLARAETFYVNAKRPELALKAYQDARIWTEALRVAKKYLPNKLQEVNAAYSRSMEDGEGEASADILLQSAKMWEKSRDYSRAIDAYLSITESQLDDADQLEEIWENAVKLAMTHEKDRYHEVVATVSKRLQDIKRFEQAAELYEGVEQYKEAVDCYMQANAFEKARAVATQNAPELVDYVANAFRSYLIQSKQADQLVHHGDVHSGLDMYAQRGEWQRCLEIAQEQGPDVLNKYVSQYLRALVQDEQFEVGGQLLARYGAPIIPGNFAAYKSIAVELISRCDESSLNDLKSVLQQLVSNLRTSRDNNIQSVAEEFEKLLLIAHLMVLRFACAKHTTLKELVARQSVALLRYIGIIPIDRAFYEAGVACKAVKWMNMAFVFTNRYLDLTEAMEDADNSVMFDNADFEHTDIPSPYDVTLPEKQCLSDDAREEVRDWVLQVSMDQKIEQSLSTRPCDKCHKPIYDGSLSCYSCHYALPPCVITGYPVLPSAKVSCKTCARPANKTAWNQFVQVFKACPWCATQQSPMY
eukprot:GILJ01005162.1.p1 GENE.GILJ01005162.1~~GILJ01005162.1.p1  ORF type:complete len:1182 (-),score=172.76 GILJ01005162.1:116-3661(-)